MRNRFAEFFTACVFSGGFVNSHQNRGGFLFEI
jgi:hypothetical protein